MNKPLLFVATAALGLALGAPAFAQTSAPAANPPAAPSTAPAVNPSQANAPAANMPASAGARAVSDAECATAWKTADKNNDGFVTTDEAARYLSASRVGGRTIAGDRLAQADFMTDCQAGRYLASANDPGAPLNGANSFTEGQAKERAMARGFSDVSTLNKDGDGIWRGTASHDGKKVNIALDFKGNVVAN